LLTEQALLLFKERLFLLVLLVQIYACFFTVRSGNNSSKLATFVTGYRCQVEALLSDILSQIQHLPIEMQTYTCSAHPLLQTVMQPKHDLTSLFQIFPGLVPPELCSSEQSNVASVSADPCSYLDLVTCIKSLAVHRHQHMHQEVTHHETAVVTHVDM